MTVFEIIRNRLLRNVIITPVGDKKESWKDLRRIRWNEEFEVLMRNRRIVGRFRYGHPGDKDYVPVDCIKAMKQKITAYERTGNTECLVDIANYAMVEFTYTNHPSKHFKSVDDGEHAEKIDAVKKGNLI
jgi:hypothetical protein